MSTVGQYKEAQNAFIFVALGQFQTIPYYTENIHYNDVAVIRHHEKELN